MTVSYQTPGKILSIEEYLSHTAEFDHLFEICQQPPETIMWQTHDEFTSAGTLFLGDLNLKEQETENLLLQQSI